MGEALEASARGLALHDSLQACDIHAEQSRGASQAAVLQLQGPRVQRAQEDPLPVCSLVEVVVLAACLQSCARGQSSDKSVPESGSNPGCSAPGSPLI